MVLSNRSIFPFLGGWWSGSPTLTFDRYTLGAMPKIQQIFIDAMSVSYELLVVDFRDFVKKVESKFPKDKDIIVVCQKGLR